METTGVVAEPDSASSVNQAQEDAVVVDSPAAANRNPLVDGGMDGSGRASLSSQPASRHEVQLGVDDVMLLLTSLSFLTSLLTSLAHTGAGGGIPLHEHHAAHRVQVHGAAQTAQECTTAARERRGGPGGCGRGRHRGRKGAACAPGEARSREGLSSHLLSMHSLLHWR